MAETDKTFMGTGWGFPPTFDSTKNTVVTVSGVEDIKESLHILLSTSLGERIKREDFGANVNNFLFEPTSVNNLAVLKDMIEKAILLNESRIKLQNVLLEPFDNEGLIRITIEFILRTTNTRINFVYPFYLKEGINL